MNVVGKSEGNERAAWFQRHMLHVRPAAHTIPALSHLPYEIRKSVGNADGVINIGPHHAATGGAALFFRLPFGVVLAAALFSACTSTVVCRVSRIFTLYVFIVWPPGF